MTKVEAISVIGGSFMRRANIRLRTPGQLKEYRRVVQAFGVLGLTEAEKQQAEAVMEYRSAAGSRLYQWLRDAIEASKKPKPDGTEAVKE